ncbi:12997_t:CDS:2 [Ambispora gerdemannii]|uniref:12997_t:CDS:1 n=1 Tax=Ambispora gerdemannii TaxID=144530 RepID=A0A9N9D4K1_9GLOM|nr:12997_t:CDS:2 [Ambispora gerdemannii]
MGTFTDKGGFGNDYLEGSYIALFALLIIWATLILFAEFVRKKEYLTGEGGRGYPRATSAGDEGVSETSGLLVTERREESENRYVKTANAARDAILMLLIATVATQVGHGATVASAVLTWIFFGLAILWILSVLLFDHIWIPLVFQALALPFLVAIFALAFRPYQNYPNYPEYPPPRPLPPPLEPTPSYR